MRSEGRWKGLLVGMCMVGLLDSSRCWGNTVAVVVPGQDQLQFQVYSGGTGPSVWNVPLGGMPPLLIGPGGALVPMLSPGTPAVPLVGGSHPLRQDFHPVLATWREQPNFPLLRTWRTADTLAVLDQPRVPLAWKGDRPRAVYAWCGGVWYEMKAAPRHRETSAQVIKRHRGALVDLVGRRGLGWSDYDTLVLAQVARDWKYRWMGVVSPINVW